MTLVALRREVYAARKRWESALDHGGSLNYRQAMMALARYVGAKRRLERAMRQR